jgi:hypothetical protein
MLFVLSINLYSQDEEIQKLFPGKWKMDITSSEVYEEWEIKSEDELSGISYSIDEDKKSVSEYLYLKSFGGLWSYIAHPVDQSITLFALVEHTPKKFVFENKEHDFPQRIIYEFHKDGKLTAAIEGDINGVHKRKEFSFKLFEE